MNKITFAFKKMINERVGRLEERWDFNSQAVLLSSPVVGDIDGDGKKEIVFGTKDGRIVSITSDGKLKWSFSAQESMSQVELMFIDTETANSISGAPNVEDINFDNHKEIVFGTEAGILYTLDHNGNLLWKFKTGGPIRGAPLVQKFANRQVGIIFGSSDHSLYFLNQEGKVFWKYDCGSDIESCPGIILASQPLIVFGSNDGVIHALDLRGKLVWQFKTKNKILAQPVGDVLAKNTQFQIIIGSTDGNLYSLSEHGDLLWNYHTNGAICSKAVIADLNADTKKEIVFGSCDNCVHTLDDTGKKLWSYETDFWVVASPIVTDMDNDGKLEVVVGSYDHNIYVLDSEGSYMLDYVPGVSGIVGQNGQYGDGMTQEPGKTVGKKLWQYQAEGIIVGCAYVESDRHLIISTDKGKIKNIHHTNNM